MKKEPEIPTTNTSEIEGLIKRVESNQLSEGDKQLVGRLLRFVISLLAMVQKKNATIARLKKMLFGPGGGKEQQENQTSTATEKEPTTKDPSNAQQQSTADQVNITERKA